MNDDGDSKWKLCVRWSAAADHPAAFRWHASSKKNWPSWCLFPFRMATVLPLRTAWIADILSQASLRDVQRQRCWKRGSGDGQRLSLWDYGTTERSINVVDRRGSTLIWTVCKAADSEERQICTTCLFAESVGLWKDDGLMLSPIVEHSSVWEGLGEEGRFDVAPRSETPKPSCQSHKQQLLLPRSGPSKAAHTRTTRGERTASTEQISKKGIKLILNFWTIGNRKGYCAWNCSRWQAQPEKNCKMQRTNQYNVRSERHWFVRCDLQISQAVLVTTNNFTHNLLFYFQ